jgi:hypothetical protein
MDIDDHFEHFGIKGMKWGVRRSRPDEKYPINKPVGAAIIVGGYFVGQKIAGLLGARSLTSMYASSAAGAVATAGLLGNWADKRMDDVKEARDGANA